MASPTRPTHLRCNFLSNPLGLDDPAPRLSWQVNAGGRRGARQTAYRLRVSTQRNGAADLWDSGKINSATTDGIASLIDWVAQNRTLFA